LPAGAFARIDEEPDAWFYDQPRFVQHIDEGAIAAVTETIRRHVPPGAAVLDLMSSWVSHLPPAAELPLARVVGLGMNAEELAGNPRLDEWVVQDLNADPRLPYPDASFDAVLITVSIQYLTRPVATLGEVARVLRSGGVVIVSFSNRLFPSKATRIWQETPDEDRWALVRRYLVLAGGFAEPAVEAHRPSRRRFGGDPLWAVVARRG
jgi:SAM-dependent methyltransferase